MAVYVSDKSPGEGELELSTSFIIKISDPKNMDPKYGRIKKYNISKIIEDIFTIIKMNGSLGFLRIYKHNTEKDDNLFISINKYMNDLKTFINNPNHTEIRDKYLGFHIEQREVGLIFIGMYGITFNKYKSSDDIEDENYTEITNVCSDYSIYSLMIFMMNLYDKYQKYNSSLINPSENGGLIVNPSNGTLKYVNSTLYCESNLRTFPLMQYDFPDDVTKKSYDIINLDDIMGCINSDLYDIIEKTTVLTICTASYGRFVSDIIQYKKSHAAEDSQMNVEDIPSSKPGFFRKLLGFQRKYLKYKKKYLKLKNLN